MLAPRGHLAARSGLAIAACTLVGCAYEPSSFSFLARSSPAVRATIGCLDLAITPSAAPRADAHAVLAYEFGNRCDGPTVVDLSAMAVVGRAVDDRAYALAAFDPKRELRSAVLDGRSQGRELIAYPTEVTLLDVCVDVAAIAHQAPVQWLCVAMRADHDAVLDASRR